MRITVIGANGRSGKLVVEYALQKGWQVVAYLRNKSKLPLQHANLTFVEGDAYNDTTIEQAITGSDAVVSALGQSDISGEVNLMSDGLKRIIPAMNKLGVKRIVTINGRGALQADEHTLTKDLPDFPAEYKGVSEGHYRAYEVLKDTDLDWTYIGCPYIPDGERTGKYVTKKDYSPEGLGQIFTGDIADFVLNELEANQYIKTRVGITNI